MAEQLLDVLSRYGKTRIVPDGAIELDDGGKWMVADCAWTSDARGGTYSFTVEEIGGGRRTVTVEGGVHG